MRELIDILVVIISPVDIVPPQHNRACFDQTDSSLADQKHLQSLKIGRSRN